MPFPAKPEGTAHKALVSARISPIEKEQLEQLLDGVTMSAYIANLIADHLAEKATTTR